MKKIYALLLLVIFTLESTGQNPQLLGMTENGGGSYIFGSILKISGDGSNFQNPYLFPGYSAAGPNYGNNFIQATNGKLYTMTQAGGRYNQGVIFSYDPITSIYATLYDFTGGNDGGYAQGSLIQATNGKLYGMANYGPGGGDGVIFSFDPVTNIYTVIHDFTGGTDGSTPYGSLMQASNGKLYGMTYSGGFNDLGIIFSYDPSNSSYNKLFDFAGSGNGAHPSGNLIQATNGKLYGETYQGGASGYGVIFSYDPLTTTYAVLGSVVNTSGACGSLIQATNGKLYGIEDGCCGTGDIFSFNIATNTKTIVYSFNNALLGIPRGWGILCQATSGLLYGMGSGGCCGGGVIFSFDAGTNNYAKLYEFSGLDGSQAYGNLIQASNGRLYGMAGAGGIGGVGGMFGGGSGVIFDYNIGTATYTKLLDLYYAPKGSRPQGNLIKGNNGKFYGMTSLGGSNNKGVIFSYDSATSIYTKMFDFTQTNGEAPKGSLVLASNGKLYGMTEDGGSNSLGVLFSYDITTSTYSQLVNFSGTSNGSNPKGNLIQATNGKLYGMTQNGGAFNDGVIFSYDPSTNTYSKIFDFSGSNGSTPTGSLIQASNGKLYGVAGGGTNGGGVIFSYDLTNSTYTKLLDFIPFSNGSGLYGNLLQASDGKLYGMANTGGNNNLGVIFSYDPATTNYTKLLDFDGAAYGSNPQGGLIQASNWRLYGMTRTGGSNDRGVIFSYDIYSSTFTKLKDLNDTVGIYPTGNLTEIEPISSIATSTVAASVCQGSSISVPFVVTGIFNNGNVFTAQLSDSNGSFSNPLTVGNLAGTTSGTVNANIPSNVTAGAGYRIRVIGSNPFITGLDNGVNVTILASVTPTLNVSANPGANICVGTSVTFTANATNGGTTPVYQWKKNGNNVGNSSPIYTDSALTNGDSVTCILTSNAICPNPATITTTIPVIVHALPNVIINANTPACQGSNFNLATTGGVSFVWSGPNGFNSNQQNPVVANITIADSGNYFVTVTDANNCVANANAVLSVLTPPIQELCIVTVDSFSTHNIVIWEKAIDHSMVDSFLIYREITTNNYQKIGAVERDSLSAFDDFGANPNQQGYRYKITVLDTCGNEGLLSQTSYHNTVHLQYQGNGNFNWNSYSIEGQGIVVSTYNVFRDNNGTGNWFQIGSVAGTQNTFSDLNYSSFPNALYRIEVSWISGHVCTPTRSSIYTTFSNIRSLNTTSIANTFTEGAIKIYPNPASSQLFIEINNLLVTEIDIYNAIGSLVAETKQLQNKYIDVSTLPNGIYIAEIKMKDVSVKRRWVKM